MIYKEYNEETGDTEYLNDKQIGNKIYYKYYKTSLKFFKIPPCVRD